VKEVEEGFGRSLDCVNRKKMPKNKGRNAFFFFMVDWRKRAEAQGCKFPNGFKDVQADPECNEEWQVMSTRN